MQNSNDQHHALADVLTESFGSDVEIESLQQRQFRAGELGIATLSIVEMAYTRVNRSQNGPTTTTRIRQTAVVLDDDQLELPQFTLAPTQTGMLGMVMALVGGMGDINFDDSPQFSQQYYLHGWAEQPVRALFTKELREHLAQQPGWNAIGKGRYLVVYQHDRVYDNQQLESFLAQALPIVELFQQGEEQLDADPSLERQTRPEDFVATADRMGGVVGTMLKNQLMRVAVTPQQLSDFLRQPPPRTIPSGVRRQVLGQNIPLIVIGALFFLAGAIAGPLILTLVQGNDRWAGLIFLLTFTPVGAGIVFFTAKHRLRKRRTLQYGQLVHGKVVAVKRTQTSINDQRRYHVSIEFEQDGRSRREVCNAYAIGVDKAKQLLESGQQVRVLVDPNDPSHIVCADLLLVWE